MKIRNILLLLVSFFFIGSVSAATAPKITDVSQVSGEAGDLIKVTAEAGSNPISYYLIGQTVGSATRYDASSTSIYMSVPNGTFNIWAVDTTGVMSSTYSVLVTNSCDPAGVSNVTGSGTVKLCGVKTASPESYSYIVNSTADYGKIATCANGYTLDLLNTTQLVSNCNSSLKVSTYGLSKRYCTQTWKYVCYQPTITVSSYLSSLSLSSGTLSPSFQSGTTTYTATVDASNVTVNATIADSNASFVDGYGPRTVNLNVGTNTIEVKVRGSKITTYTINITRPSHYSTVNTLSGLSLEGVSLSPNFNSNTVKYTASVSNDVSSIKINAFLTDSTSSFVTNYGPRTVSLKEGSNSVLVKVKSQSGSVRVYTITVTRASAPVEPTVEPEPVVEPVVENTKPLLSSLTLSEGDFSFDANIFDYNVTVPYDVTNVVATSVPEDESYLVNCTGGNDLVVGGNELTVTVTNPTTEESTVYSIYITRSEENREVSTDKLLKKLEIEGHSIKFDASKNEYKVTLNEGETELKITAEANSEYATVTISGNENLSYGSVVEVKVTAENNDENIYKITIGGAQKSGHPVLIFFLVLLIILVVAYAVLRIMGYRIQFNLEAVSTALTNLFAKK